MISLRMALLSCGTGSYLLAFLQSVAVFAEPALDTQSGWATWRRHKPAWHRPSSHNSPERFRLREDPERRSDLEITYARPRDRLRRTREDKHPSSVKRKRRLTLHGRL
jgi:hypothetical protein